MPAGIPATTRSRQLHQLHHRQHDGVPVGTNGTLSGVNNGFYNNTNLSPFGASAVTGTNQPFRHAYAGDYYLTTNSGFQGQGTSNIDALLLSGLPLRTTSGPTVYTNLTITSTTTPGIRGIEAMSMRPTLATFTIHGLPGFRPHDESDVRGYNGVSLGFFGPIYACPGQFVSQGLANGINQ